MFNKKFEERMFFWHDFREHLETCEDPLQEVIDLYAGAPLVSIVVDPYDKTTWLDPWQLLKENLYCDFSTVLAQCYSLQLTERFKEVPIEIHISTDKEKSANYYLLYVNERVIGYDKDTHVSVEKIPKTVQSQTVYPMLPIQ